MQSIELRLLVQWEIGSCPKSPGTMGIFIGQLRASCCGGM